MANVRLGCRRPAEAEMDGSRRGEGGDRKRKRERDWEVVGWVKVERDLKIEVDGAPGSPAQRGEAAKHHVFPG